MNLILSDQEKKKKLAVEKSLCECVGIPFFSNKLSNFQLILLFDMVLSLQNKCTHI